MCIALRAIFHLLVSPLLKRKLSVPFCRCVRFISKLCQVRVYQDKGAIPCFTGPCVKVMRALNAVVGWRVNNSSSQIGWP